MKPFFLIIVVCMILAGCAASKIQNSADQVDACLKQVDLRPENAVAKTLVGYDVRPSPSQLANHKYPTRRHVDLIGNYWDQQFQCRSNFERDLNAVGVDATSPEMIVFNAGLNQLYRVQGEFLSGGLTYTEYFHEKMKLRETVQTKLAQIKEQNRQQAAASAKAFADGFNRCMKSYKPITMPSIRGNQTNCTSTNYGGIVKTTCD